MEEKIMEARKDAGLTQEALAKRMKVSASTISSWETGKSEPSEKEIARLEKILNTSFTDIELSTTVIDVLRIIYVIILIVIPGIYFIGECHTELNGFYTIGSEVDNLTKDIVTTYTNSILQGFIIIYGWYAISNIANYIFFKIKQVHALEVVLIIETIIFALSIVFMTSSDSVLESVLLVIPILTGVFQYGMVKKDK